jgi:hypothetical protein
VKRFSGRKLQQDFAVLSIIKRSFLHSHRSAVPSRGAYPEAKSLANGIPLRYLKLEREDSWVGGFVEDMAAVKTRHPSRE